MATPTGFTITNPSRNSTNYLFNYSYRFFIKDNDDSIVEYSYLDTKTKKIMVDTQEVKIIPKSTRETLMILCKQQFPDGTHCERLKNLFENYPS